VNVLTAARTAKNRILVNIEVTERPTGLFSIGGGYSSVDSFVARWTSPRNNFLGRGWQLGLRIRAAPTPSRGQISFTEPCSSTGRWPPASTCSARCATFDEYQYDTVGGNRCAEPPVSPSTGAGARPTG